ncbi:hypothetical protein CDD83_6213 [Cordyceps sp. RAO-2017]|nr:hypothetical protein CDD83_6213 [Cordyceps sp. RAO-2017]
MARCSLKEGERTSLDAVFRCPSDPTAFHERDRERYGNDIQTPLIGYTPGHDASCSEQGGERGEQRDEQRDEQLLVYQAGERMFDDSALAASPAGSAPPGRGAGERAAGGGSRPRRGHVGDAGGRERTGGRARGHAGSPPAEAPPGFRRRGGGG